MSTSTSSPSPNSPPTSASTSANSSMNSASPPATTSWSSANAASSTSPPPTPTPPPPRPCPPPSSPSLAHVSGLTRAGTVFGCLIGEFFSWGGFLLIFCEGGFLNDIVQLNYPDCPLRGPAGPAKYYPAEDELGDGLAFVDLKIVWSQEF